MGIINKGDVSIREMIINDIDIIIDLEEVVFKESLGYDMLYKELSDNSYSRYLVICLNNEIIGYVGFWIMYTDSQIINFLIAPKYQGNGYGKDLFDKVISICNNENVKDITLEVRASNIIAQSFYKKYGFIKVAVRKSYYKDNEDAYLLQKLL